MMNYALPEKDADHLEDEYEIEKKSKKSKKKLRGASTSFYVAYPEEKDDVEKMKERAATIRRVPIIARHSEVSTHSSIA